MENLIFFACESWSTSADQFFGMFAVGAATPATDMFQMFWALFRVIAATAFVALLAWFVTKKLAAANRRGFSRKSDANLSVMESINVGGQAVVQLVKAGEKYLVIGVTKERVTMLAELDAEQVTLPESVEYSPLNSPFGKVLSRFIAPKGEQKSEDDDLEK